MAEQKLLAEVEENGEARRNELEMRRMDIVGDVDRRRREKYA